MVCCFSGDPVDGDERGLRPNKFQISLGNAICKGQPCCCFSCFCPCCSACSARKKVLDDDMSRYICCQGYVCPQGCCCIKPGSIGETSCPDLCLCLESFCCVGPSMSSSRLFSMDKHNLANDSCDNRMIRFSNCLQMLACICNILAIIIEPLRELARLINCIADAVFYSMLACMSAQIHLEEDFQKNAKFNGGGVQQATPYNQYNAPK